MINRFLLAALTVSVSFCAFSEPLDYWLYDALANTITDNEWTFAVTASSKNLTVGACAAEVGFPANVSTLDLSKPVKDSSDAAYTIVKLGTLFGKTSNNWKDDTVSTETGLTLGEVILPPTGLTSIGDGAFGGCASLTNVVNFLPDSVTTVGQAVFYGSKVRCDLYAYGVTSFDRCAFTGVPITSVHFGKNLTSIGNGSNKQAAFQSCSSLTNVVFHPESKGINIMKSGINATTTKAAPLYLYGVSAIGESGFEGMKVSEVVFDKCISSISATDAFKSCQFTKATFLGPPPNSWKVVYSGVNTKVTTYVSAAYRELWEPLVAGGSIPDDGETTFSAEVCSAAGISDVSKRPVRLIPGSLPVEIFTAADFVAQMAANSDGWFVLKDDIDLTGSGYVTVSRFGGVLDGEGHTISGVGPQPLFNAVSGTIRNLTLDGTVGGGITVIGYAAAEVRGALCNTLLWGAISDVVVKGYRIKAPSFAQTSWVGLIAGQVYNESTIERCMTAEGSELFGSNNGYGGGLVGQAAASGSPFRGPSIIDCTNRAACAYSQDVYGGGGLGGIVGNLSAASKSSQIRRCVNFADIISPGYKGLIIGGIVGAGSATLSNAFLVADCVNYGDIEGRHKDGGFVFGGIVGSTIFMTLTNCANYGNLSIVSNATVGAGKGTCGGIIGNFSSTPKPTAGTGVSYVIDCANYGNMTSPIENAAGIFGKISLNDDYSTYMECRNCANYGVIDGVYVGEVCSRLYDEKKRYSAKAHARYTVQNCFFRTAKLHHPWTETNGWCTESGNVTAEDEEYSAASAAATLTSVACENGWSKWRVASLPYPELVCVIGDIMVNRGLTIIFR